MVSLKEMLRDRLVCGVNHDGIQRKLLLEKELTYYDKDLLTQNIETAEQDSKNLKTSAISITQPGSPQVHGA